MQIKKKIKCVECQTIVEVLEGVTCECSCKKVVIVEGHITGTSGVDYIDVSPKLLNE